MGITFREPIALAPREPCCIEAQELGIVAHRSQTGSRGVLRPVREVSPFQPAHVPAILRLNGEAANLKAIPMQHVSSPHRERGIDVLWTSPDSDLEGVRLEVSALRLSFSQ
jgi:hypothetical protein